MECCWGLCHTVRFRLPYDNSQVGLCTAIGVFLLLTVQATTALIQRPRHESKITYPRRELLFYIFITFLLGTISFAANAKYTEMIWIDLRDAPGDPVALIMNVLSYRINILAISWSAPFPIYL